MSAVVVIARPRRRPESDHHHHRDREHLPSVKAPRRSWCWCRPLGHRKFRGARSAWGGGSNGDSAP
eukprot:4016455-Pyramimonas_sp.AAC.1